MDDRLHTTKKLTARSPYYATKLNFDDTSRPHPPPSRGRTSTGDLPTDISNPTKGALKVLNDEINNILFLNRGEEYKVF